MARAVNTTEQAAELRRRAEELVLRHAAPASADPESTLPAWVVEMLHELRVHQIELEMQNEELRRSQIKLDEANARYFDLYDLAPVGYFTLSESGTILEANLYAASRLGVSRVALVQQPFSRFISRGDQDDFYLHRRKLSEIGSVESWDLRMVRQDGTQFWARLDAATAWEADGPPVLRVTMGDISTRKLAEDQQRRLEAELQHAQSMESLGTLTGGIAHDMNNVLGAILGVASANLDNQPDGSPAYHAFDIITRAAERGAMMVRSLQSLASRQPAEEKELNLNGILQGIVRLLERTTFHKFRLETSFSADLNPIRGDANALSNAFMNLFVNSLDAMAPGGTLTIRTRNIENHQVEILVEDTGMGMSVETLAKALEPYFTTKDVGKGTGLGLSIADSTIKAHHGHMEIQSEPGHRTCVILRFPAVEAASTIDAPVRVPGAGHVPGSLTVLVVDDDELIRGSMQALLAALGHTSAMASGGDEAMAMLQSGLEADVVILDLNMPGMDGSGTLPRIRALRPSLPVLIATGRADQAALDLSHRYPGVNLIQKPFGMAALQEHLERLLGNIEAPFTTELPR
jgi:PAS domain S-box-containing protein